METTYKEVIPIPIKPNKKKVKGYYKTFFRAKTKNINKVWKFLDKLIRKLGNPFEKKSTGRPPKFKNLDVYVKSSILIGYFDFTLDEIEGLLPLLAGDSLDRGLVEKVHNYST